jgi:hypothetical protein
MAYKVFSNGDALTGGELNTFLMNQSVISFATTTARDAALPSPLEGQLVWLEDSNKYVYYTGSAWTDLISPVSSGNAIINGGFDIWQRGTSVVASGSTTFLADRFKTYRDGTGATLTVSQQTFTPGTAPVSGYEAPFFLRLAQSVAGSGTTYSNMDYNIEDVRTFAGQTVTFSFFAKAAASTTVSNTFVQGFGSGGSGDVYTSGSSSNLTTSWARYTQTLTIPSISGKTVGSSSYLAIQFGLPKNATFTIDIWGVQLEAGSTATAFKRNGANIGEELASCQRYYFRNSGGTAYAPYSIGGNANSSTSVFFSTPYPVTLRTAPTSVEFSTLRVSDGTNAQAVTALTLDVQSSPHYANIGATVASGLTQFRGYTLQANNSTSAFLGFSAEL